MAIFAFSHTLAIFTFAHEAFYKGVFLYHWHFFADGPSIAIFLTNDMRFALANAISNLGFAFIFGFRGV